MGAADDFLRVVGEARKLIVHLRQHVPEAPYEGLFRALTTFDSHFPKEGKVDGGLRGMRVMREDLLEGCEYLLSAPKISTTFILFTYLGETGEDCATGQTCPSFWMKRAGSDKEEKWFFCDAGLEPYSKFSHNPWWHTTNKVIRPLIDENLIMDILDRECDSDVDFDS